MWFSIGFAASCAVAVYLLSGSVLGWLALAFGVLSILSLLFKQRFLKVTGVVLLGFSVGVLWMWIYDGAYLQTARQYDGKTIMASIEASDYFRNTEYGGSVDGKLNLDDKSYHVRLYLNTKMDIKPGDKIHGVYTLGMTTPNGKEESDYYQGKGIFLLADPEGAVSVESAAKVPGKYFAAQLRQKITSLMNEMFPQDTVGFSRALLLGDSSLLSYETDTSLKVSGIRHVIAVSGLHVSILFALIYTVALRRRVSTALLGIPILILFAAVTGFTPSVNRACIMQTLLIFALLFDKEYDPPTALAFAVLVMLAENPMSITSVSFQMSVGCVVGIFLFSGKISRYLLNKFGHPTGRSLWARTARWISGSAGVSIAAMTFTMPLLALYFGMVSLVSVFANLLTLWVMSIIFYGIMLGCVLGAIWLPLGQIIAWGISWLIRYVQSVANLLASAPMAAVYTDSVYIVCWIVICYVLFGAFWLFKKKSPVLLLSCMAVCLCISLVASYAEPKQDDLRVTVFSVGEGQSILIQTYGEYYLVDCGTNSGNKAADTVAQTLLSQGITKLDGVILTNYDKEHAGDILALLSRVGTEKIYLPDIASDNPARRELESRQGKIIHKLADDVIIEKERWKLSLFTAMPDSKKESESGLCILFQAKDYDILITGDRKAAGEAAILDTYDLPKLDLLVAGGHGSDESTCFDLLSKTMPKTVVISCSDKYGHPAEKLLQRLAMFGCSVRRTDQEGTIIFRG